MDNMIVAAVASGLQERGVATLRFNFRGTGRSGGAHGCGTGEVEDVAAAAGFMRSALPRVSKVVLFGHSFGAYVGALSMDRDTGFSSAALPAPPTAWGTGYIGQPGIETLLVCGDRDDCCDHGR
jgi:alpha/beta superfamily hydrolase